MAGSPAAGVAENENNHKRRARWREGEAVRRLLFRKPLSVSAIIILIIRTPLAIDLPIRLI